MNLNELARRVTLREGGAVNLSIAQVKEVLRIVFTMMSRMPHEKVRSILKRYRDRGI